ncbi:MAG: DEAD/DEAH box helicase family protein [Oligoflexia bacterium]|nr:DEAD/DEAH box helicase family protein [Oligoflexia bacterium]
MTDLGLDKPAASHPDLEPEEPGADPLLLDAEALAALASQAVVRRGFAYFREERVMDLGFEQGLRLWATVEGSQQTPYQLEIWLDEDREICLECGCPYDNEPVCKHAVAALIAYASRQPVSDTVVASAADEAVADRGQRGRTEVQVHHVDGDRWCGTWQASSLSGSSGGPYQVDLRTVGDRLNTCTCPDFATNRLGTCKHIEAVRHHLRVRAPKKFQRLATQGLDRPLVHVDWQGPDAPAIRLRTPTGWRSDAALTQHFDPVTGVFRGRIPEDLPVLTELSSKGLRVGTDVAEFASHLAADAAQAERSRRIQAALERTGGHLDGVDARLYPYQVAGVAFLAGRGRAMLADDMGLGKTLQAIAATTVLQAEEGVRRTLIVCPASLKYQWAREIQRFTGQDTVVVQGSRQQRATLYGLQATFTVVNYELVLRDHPAIQRRLSPDLLILDEAQRIKNWRTKTAAAVKALDTRFAFVLTGTPLENRLEDLYSLMQVVDPRVLGPLWSFMLEFHVSDPTGRVLGYRNLSELRTRLSTAMLRRDRRLIADQLPARINHRLDVKLDKKQRELHDDAWSAAARLACIMKRRPLTPSESHRMMAALQRARMACDAAGLVDKETKGSPKLDELKELLSELCVDGDHKVVVFTEWERMSRKAMDVATGLGLGVIRLHGGVDTKKRGGLIDRFEKDPLARVFISTDAGSTGLNLQCATALVNLDLPWNPAVLDQRIARIHRLGQSQSVQVFVLVAKDSYEERVAGLVAGKRRLFDNAVDPQGVEDAVGLSRRAVEMAAELLGSDGQAQDDEVEESGPETSSVTDEWPQALPVEPTGPAPAIPESPTRSIPPDRDLSALVSRLGLMLPGRIERIVAREGGLIVVIDRVDEASEAVAKDLRVEFSLVIIDGRTWAGLCMIEPALADAVPTALAPPPPPARPSPARKLAAARVLLDQDLVAEALDLVLDGLLLALAGDETPPPRDQAALWLFGTQLPAGRASTEDAALVARGLALSQIPELPASLVRAALDDADGVVARAG